MGILLTNNAFTVIYTQLVLVLSFRLPQFINAIQPLALQSRVMLTNDSDTGLSVDRPSQYVGVVQCICSTYGSNDTPLFGYIFWSDIVHDINNAFASSYIMCPTHYHDAINLPKMIITQSDVAIQCGEMGEPDGCIVDGASIAIGENLKNVTIRGVEFVSQRSELTIGDGSQISLIGCRFSDTIFSGLNTLRSAVVSYGELSVVGSYFSGNYGGGAVHVAQQSASFINVQFIDNVASQSEHSASAIQVGNVTNSKVANVSIIDSCFENNVGTNIVMVNEGSLLLRNRGNAVLVSAEGKTKCHGVTIQNGGGGTVCKKFQVHNVSCHDAFHRCGPIVLDTIAPTTTPAMSFTNTNATTESITLSPVQPSPSAAPTTTVKVEPNATTLPPVQAPASAPQKIMSLQPTVSVTNAVITNQPVRTVTDDDDPLLNLTAASDDDSIVPLDITRDFTIATSGYSDDFLCQYKTVARFLVGVIITTSVIAIVH